MFFSDYLAREVIIVPVLSVLEKNLYMFYHSKVRMMLTDKPIEDEF